MILVNHVKNGVELAEKYHLPPPVKDIIQQHHGTSTIRYFWNKAQQQKLPLQNGDFRYPGPKPQTREALIVMLADVIESASRSLNERNIGKIEHMVHHLVKSVLLDGQMDEVAIFVSELKILEKSFISTLTGIKHRRIEYPQEKS